jgi:hypothetical protein
VIFHHKRHPAEMGDAEVGQFLTDPAEKQGVSASTQNQALLQQSKTRSMLVCRFPAGDDSPVKVSRDEQRGHFRRIEAPSFDRSWMSGDGFVAQSNRQ